MRGTVDPLTPLAFWGWKPPYTTDQPSARGGEFAENAYITAVRSKSGLAMGAVNGTSAHCIAILGARVTETKIQYAARYLCHQGSRCVVLLPENQTDVPLCSRCASAGPVVYRCFDTDGHLLYIGSSVNVANRYSYHRWEKNWWADVARTEEQRFPSLPAARVAERKAIEAERPLHNHSPRTAGAGAA